MIWDKLLGLISPYMWRALAIAALAALILGCGYVWGDKHKQAELDAFKAATAKAGADRAAETALTEALQKRNNEEVQNDYERRFADLRRKYAGWVPVNAGGGAVPIMACGSGKADGTTTDAVSVEEYRSLAAACTETTLMVTDLQALWLKNQRLPH